MFHVTCCRQEFSWTVTLGRPKWAYFYVRLFPYVNYKIFDIDFFNAKFKVSESKTVN